MRFPTKAEVTAENQRRMDRLTGATRTYKSHDIPGVDDRGRRIRPEVAVKLLNKEIVPETLRLKVRTIPMYRATANQPPPQIGCQVMLIKVGQLLRRPTYQRLIKGNFRISSMGS